MKNNSFKITPSRVTGIEKISGRSPDFWFFRYFHPNIDHFTIAGAAIELHYFPVSPAMTYNGT
jgi:hypothetical protein